MQHRAAGVTVRGAAQNQRRAARAGATRAIVLGHKRHRSAAHVDGARAGTHIGRPNKHQAATGRARAGKAATILTVAGRASVKTGVAGVSGRRGHGAVVGGAGAAAAAHNEPAGRGLGKVGPAEAARGEVRIPGVAAHTAAAGVGAAAAAGVLVVIAGPAVGAAAAGITGRAAGTVAAGVAVGESAGQQGRAYGVGCARVEHGRSRTAGPTGFVSLEVVLVVKVARGAGRAFALVGVGVAAGRGTVVRIQAARAAQLLARAAAEATAGHVHLKGVEIERAIDVEHHHAAREAVPARGRDVGRQVHVAVERNANHLVATLAVVGRGVGVAESEAQGLGQVHQASAGIITRHH